MCGEERERAVEKVCEAREGAAKAGSERAPLQAGDKSERRNCWRVWFEMMLVGRKQYVWVAVQLGGCVAL